MLVLFCGYLLYAHARNPIYDFPAVLHIAPLARWASSHTVSRWCGCLPSGIHVAAMSLLTAALLPQKRKTFFIVCVSWIGINAVFEILQRVCGLFFDTPSFQAVAGHAFFANVIGYFTMGTYDNFDLLAALAGGLIALGILFSTRSIKKESAG